MAQFLLSLSYDGGSYHGWVIQKNQRTVQGVLNQALKRITKTKNFHTLGASKTDSGVHALDQKVLLKCGFIPSNLENFQKALNKALPLDLNVQSLTKIDDDFVLSRQIKQKIYTYDLITDWNLYDQRYAWLWNFKNLDSEGLEKISQIFVGNHNFQNFSGLTENELLKISPWRSISQIKVKKTKKGVQFQITGKSFIRYQIRMLVAAVLAVYQGKRYQSNDLIGFLKNPQFNKFPLIAPPQGLCLKKITFK